MRIPADLHPADREVREGLLGILVDLRRQAGLGQGALARRMGITQPAVAQMEGHTAWRIGTVQRWALALRHRLILRPDGVPYVDVSPLRPADEVEAMAWDRRALQDALQDARTELGVSVEALARALGVTAGAIRSVEMVDDPLLISVQRIVRALGGQLAVELEPLAAPEGVAA